VAALDRDGAVLLTGATGFVGTELLARYLERDRRPIYTLVRARDSSAATARMRAVLRRLFGDEHEHTDRVIAVPADLTLPRLGLSRRAGDELASEVTEVVHGAASVTFELPLEEAREINVRGSRRVLELCARMRSLRSVAYISTAYVAGLHEGRFAEEDLHLGQSFRNTYELSKYEAERVVRGYGCALPLSVMRPSIIVGDRATGFTTSFNVLYWPLRAFAKTGFVALPARRDAPVDVVSVDYVADAVFALAARAPSRLETYHLTAGEATSTVGEIVDLSVRRFGRRAPYLVPPRLYRRVLHPVLLGCVGSERRRQLRRTESYFPYFAIGATYDERGARAALAPLGIRPSPLRDYFDRLVDFAQLAQWGRRSPPRPRRSTGQQPVVKRVYSLA
jgi:thioester reductase-like protein